MNYEPNSTSSLMPERDSCKIRVQCATCVRAHSDVVYQHHHQSLGAVPLVLSSFWRLLLFRSLPASYNLSLAF